MLPTAMRKKPLVAFEELKRKHDWCEKLLGRQQLAAGDEIKNHSSAVEAIRNCENVRRLGGSFGRIDRSGARTDLKGGKVSREKASKNCAGGAYRFVRLVRQGVNDCFGVHLHHAGV